MTMFKKLATAGAVAVMGLGVSAAGASAYAISGGPFTGGSTSAGSASIGGTYGVSCLTTTFSGTATGSATISLTPSFSECAVSGLPVNYTFSGAWDLTVIDGPSAGGVYRARLDIPAGASVTADVPLANCTVVNSGPQSFAVVTLTNTVWGLAIQSSVSGIAYTTSAGCPFSGASDADYDTNGSVLFPGVLVS